MKKRFLNTGILFMALVALLAAIGIGYAMWDKTLNIDGTVSTGNVDAQFTSACTDDDGTVDCSHDQDFGDDGIDPAGKDVGNCGATFAADTATMTIGNAYPSYECTAWFGIENNGTIPVMVQAIEQHANFGHYYRCDPVDPWTFAAASTWYPYCGTSVVKDIAVFDPVTDEIVPVLNVHVTKLVIGEQIDRDGHTGIDVHIHVKQGAAEDAMYQVDHRIYLVQWNEYTQ